MLEVRHAIVPQPAVLPITRSNLQKIPVRIGLSSEYQAASDTLPQRDRLPEVVNQKRQRKKDEINT